MRFLILIDLDSRRPCGLVRSRSRAPAAGPVASCRSEAIASGFGAQTGAALTQRSHWPYCMSALCPSPVDTRCGAEGGDWTKLHLNWRRTLGPALPCLGGRRLVAPARELDDLDVLVVAAQALRDRAVSRCQLEQIQVVRGAVLISKQGGHLECVAAPAVKPRRRPPCGVISIVSCDKP